MSRENWQSARNILCIRLDYLGDVLMCTPSMRALKQSGTDRCISLLTSPAGAAVARFIPEIDGVLEYDAAWMKSSAPHPPSTELQLVEALRACRFDAAVIFTTYSQSALPAAMLCYLADIPLRLAHSRENPYHLLTDWVREPEPQEYVRHEVRRQLDLVAAAGYTTSNESLSFHVPADDAEWAAQRLRAMGIDGQPWLLLHPGATAASRRYPPELWAQAADLLSCQLHRPLVFTGGKDEIALVENIRQNMHSASHSLAGMLDLGKLAAVIAHATVMVTGNTGPAHIAAALGTPIVDLYALTNPQHTPWKVPSRVLYHDVPCRNCYKSICPLGHNACLTRIEPHRVADAVADLFASTSAGTREAELETSILRHGFQTTVSNPLPIPGYPNPDISTWN
jgi:lipopolysaccharide heptosyltransferase II